MMLLIINFLFFALIIKNTLEEPLIGECRNVGYNAKNFDSCKGKNPYDNTKYCCFLKAGKFQECVEIIKEDVDNGVIDLTIKEIEKGIYADWEDNNGYDLNRYYNVINTLECDKGAFIKLNFFIFSFFLLF